MTKNVTHLLEQFKPQHYDVSLSIDDDRLTFTGRVTVFGSKIGKPSKRITLHQKELKIESAKLYKIDKKTKARQEVILQRINTHESFNEVRLHSESTLFPSDYEIEVNFSGIITRPMDGIYPCFFTHDNQEKKLIATQFESHHARQAFPCIDEPAAKATFCLTLDTRAGIETVSNTPILTQNTEGGRLVTTFEKTPIMSTYLLAFVVGEMGYKESRTTRGITVRTYATPDNVAHTQFALDTAVSVLDFYENYFGIEYPLTKCDMIALPDFASGAMENWGCITYREVCMLDDPANTSLSNRQLVALVVAHELAHQWFGNLVTMRWWTDLWLNEGFASWIEYLAIDNLFPEWQLWEQFLVSERERGLKLDALESTHPIEVPVHHPDEIRTIFDSISYSKGASVINMLHTYLGKRDFREGLHRYLEKHSYNNTDTIDLWAALEEVSGKPVKDFMHAWTSQPGFPVLRIEADGKTAKISQQRFYLQNTHKDTKIWPIPLLSNSPTSEDILTSQQGVFKNTADHPLLFNSGQSGFYRVNYDEPTLTQLIEHLDSVAMVDKIGLLSDLTELTKNGLSSSSSVLGALSHFRSLDRSTIWDVIAGWIGNMRLVMDDDRVREALKPFVWSLIEPQYSRLGWDKKSDDSIDDQLLRPTILSMGVSSEHPEITARALQEFDKVRDPSDVDPSLRDSIDDVDVRRSIEIDPDIRGVVFGAAARHGDKKTFNKLLSMHNSSSSSEERDALCAALTNFKQQEIITESLSLIKSEHVRLQDVTYWLVYSFMNRYAREATWEWLQSNWDWMREHFEGDLGFYRIPIFAARCFSDESFKIEYQKFFEPLRTPAFSRSIDQGLETLSWHIDWKSRDLEQIVAALSS